MTKLYFLFFILIFTSVYLGIHYYVYIRIVKGLELSLRVSSYLRLSFLLGAFLFLGGRFLNRYFPAYVLIYLGAVWMGIISIALAVFILKDILGLVLRSPASWLTLPVLVLVVVLSVYSLWNVGRGPKIKEIKVPLEKLPASWSGFTMVQLSDLHLDDLTSQTWLNSIVQTTNRLNPDLILITGDLIDEDICRLTDFCPLLKQLKARYGVFAITGNHEYYVGTEKFMEVTRQAGIIPLRKEKITVAGTIELVGIDDFAYKGKKGTVDDLSSVLKTVDFKKPVILLSHQPDIFDEAVKSGVDLQLSGHTHLGQIPPMDLAVLLYFKYPYGLYQKNSSYLYTTSGTGTWGPPMRLFSRSEIVKITVINSSQ